MRVSVLPAPDAGRIPASATAIVIDVLRATTTLTVALDHGAARVIPVADPAAALALRDATPGALACGERGGRRVEGFDLGNSPFEYERGIVAGRPLVFASTNGSQAMLAARAAERRLLGAFVNATAVADAVRGAMQVVLVCSGKLGRPALEDLACAGWILRLLEARGAEAEGAGARMARAAAPASAAESRALVHGCSHARELAALGPAWVRDLAFCAEVDAIPRAFAL